MEGMNRDTPDRILDAAEQAFAMHGLAGARTASIAEVAGVNKATLHYWFKDKESLYRAVMERTVEQVVEMAEQVLGRADRAPAEQIEAFVRGYLRILLSKPNFPRMMVREMLDGGQCIQEVLVPRLMRIGSAYVSLVAVGQQEGIFNPGFDARFAPLLTLAPIAAFITVMPTLEPWIRIGDEPLPEIFVQSVTRVLLDGMLARPSSSNAPFPLELPRPEQS